MATVRDGNKGALVIVDVQVGVMRESWDAPRVIGKVARTVERARAQGVPVVWVQHASAELPEGSAAWQWVPELVPGLGELRVHKRHPSSFEATSLEAELAVLGASHITLAGAQTNWCMRATAYAALERGYDLTLVKDAHTTEPLVLGNGARVEAAAMVDDLNVAMTWLSYPGRTTSTTTAEEASFAATGGAAPS